MGKPIPYAYRVKMVERRKKGHSFQEIAKDLGYSIAGVKKIWSTYLREGDSSFNTKYANCGRKSGFGKEVREVVNLLRDNEQGGNYVYSKLLEKYPDLPAPSPRTLQRWWHNEQTSRPRGRPSDKEKK